MCTDDAFMEYLFVFTAKDLKNKGIDSLVLMETLPYSDLIETTFLNFQKPVIQWFEEESQKPPASDMESLCSINSITTEETETGSCFLTGGANNTEGVLINTTLLDNPVSAMLSSVLKSLGWSSILIIFEDVTGRLATSRFLD